ncbi:MAG: 30S ribosomal protein S2, partial [Candidatus Coatesbacteria bacterium]
AMEEEGTLARYNKKERLGFQKEKERLLKLYGGIRDMRRLPQLVFLIDPRRESIALREANRLGIPVVALVDTNCDPDPVDRVIPGNDDAIRSIRLITATVAEASLAGRGEATEGEAAAAAEVVAEEAPGATAYVSPEG